MSTSAAWSVTLFLVNGQSEPKQRKDEAWLFQAELIVRGPAGAPVFVKRPLSARPNPEPEALAMEMTYRRQIEFAVGHGVGVHAEKAKGEWARAVEIRTSSIPAYEVEPVDAPQLDGVELDMRVLSQLAGDGFESALGPLANAYEAWITREESRLNPNDPELTPLLSVGACCP